MSVTPSTSSYTAQAPTRDEVDALAGATVVEFGTAWCGYCIAAQPLIAEAFADQAGVRHLKIEDGPGRPLGRSFRVKLWPTLVFMKDGQERARVVRPRSVDEIRAAFEAQGRTGSHPLRCDLRSSCGRRGFLRSPPYGRGGPGSFRAWRQFVLEANLAPGTHVLTSRATDAQGRTQPEQRTENRTAATTRARRTTRSGSLCRPDGNFALGRMLFTQGATQGGAPPCAVCHTLKDAGSTGAVGPVLDEIRPDARRVAQAVREGVGAMPPYRAILTEAQIQAVADYVAHATHEP